MKKLLSLMLVLTMVLSLAGCKAADKTTTETATTDTTATTDATATTEAAATTDATAETPAADAVYPTEKVLIGVELYDPTESETLEIQKYFQYLQENFNVEFKYSEAIQDADQEMKFIEDCAVAGCKGFYGYYNVSGDQQVSKVLELGMYYYGLQSYDTFKDEPNYLGGISSNGSDFEAGKALGEWVIAQGFDNVVYANGGADFGVPLFVERQNGFLEAIGDKVQVTYVKGFPNDQFFADQGAALATEGLDAVVASFNGVDFWAQPIIAAGLTNVKLATIGAINDSYLSAFKNNSLAYLVAGNMEANGFAVSTICNAVDGNAEAVQDNGAAFNFAAPAFYVANADECQKILDVQTNQKIYSAEALKTTVVSLNPAASLEVVKTLVESGNKENVMSK